MWNHVTQQRKMTIHTELTTALAHSVSLNVRSHASPQLIHKETFLGLLVR